jgi:hypothetical protein
LAVVVLQLYLFSEQQELSVLQHLHQSDFRHFECFAVVFTETVMSILLSTTFEAGMEENLRLNPLKLLSCIRFLAVESLTPLLKTSKVASRPAPVNDTGFPAASTNLGTIWIAVGAPFHHHRWVLL